VTAHKCYIVATVSFLATLRIPLLNPAPFGRGDRWCWDVQLTFRVSAIGTCVGEYGKSQAYRSCTSSSTDIKSRGYQSESDPRFSATLRVYTPAAGFGVASDHS
jgi:hypothetical protein